MVRMKRISSLQTTVRYAFRLMDFCHHIQCAVLSPCPYKLILVWDFLSSTSAVICCRTPAISITGPHHSAVPEGGTVWLVLTADHVLKIVEGDALIIPFDVSFPEDSPLQHVSSDLLKDTYL